MARFYSENINPLLKEAFELSEDLDSQNIYSWSSFVKDIVHDLSLENIINGIKNGEVKYYKKIIKKEVQLYYSKVLKHKIDSLNENSKIFLYKK